MARRNLTHGGTVPMDPGERDRAVVIQELTEGTDSSGFPTPTWDTLVSNVWMKKEDLKGQERYAAAQLTAKMDTRWEMGYRADMDPELVDVAVNRRLVYQGRVYDIVEGSQIGRREGIELMTLSGGLLQ